MNRRGFLTGLAVTGAGVAMVGPAIIRTPGLLMKVSSRHLIPVWDRAALGDLLTVRLSTYRGFDIAGEVLTLDGAPARYADELVVAQMRTERTADGMGGRLTVTAASAEDAIRMGRLTPHRFAPNRAPDGLIYAKGTPGIVQTPRSVRAPASLIPTRPREPAVVLGPAQLRSDRLRST